MVGHLSCHIVGRSETDVVLLWGWGSLTYPIDLRVDVEKKV